MTTEPRALAKVEAQQSANLVALGKAAEQDAREMVAVATSQAKVLAEIIESKHLFTMLHEKKHVNVEGWATAGTFRNLAAGVDKTEAIRNAEGTIVGYQAHAVVRNILTGVQVSEAWQTCLLEEKLWNGRPLPNLYSMAGTRACSKALRLCLSWVMVLAGFDATPAEEMDGVKVDKPAPQEAPRGSGLPNGGKCSECGADIFAFKNGGAGHKTADGKWHREPSAQAPARAPEAKAGVVVPAGDKATPELVAAIYATGARADANEVTVKAQVAARFHKLPEELTQKEAERVVAGYMQRAADKQAQVPLDGDGKE